MYMDAFILFFCSCLYAKTAGPMKPPFASFEAEDKGCRFIDTSYSDDSELLG